MTEKEELKTKQKREGEREGRRGGERGRERERERERLCSVNDVKGAYRICARIPMTAVS